MLLVTRACIAMNKNATIILQSKKLEKTGRYNYRVSTMNARFLYHKIDNFKKILEEKQKLLEYDKHFHCSVRGQVTLNYF